MYGNPAEISEYLIPSPVIRKISFTGSVPVGKQLGALAGLHMKRATMELGGHAPVLVFDDVESDGVATLLAGMKYRNAGQVCVSPTRFFLHDKVYDKFVAKFTDLARNIKVGRPRSRKQDGPLAIQAVTRWKASSGAQEKATRIERAANALEMREFSRRRVTTRKRAFMREEPFGPVALCVASTTP